MVASMCAHPCWMSYAIATLLEILNVQHYLIRDSKRACQSLLSADSSLSDCLPRLTSSTDKGSYKQAAILQTDPFPFLPWQLSFEEYTMPFTSLKPPS